MIEKFPFQGDLDFDGATYVAEFDQTRLNKQQRRVWAIMRDGRWRTLRELADATGDPEASVSARLRDFRKPPLDMTVERRRRGEAARGLFEYRLARQAHDAS